MKRLLLGSSTVLLLIAMACNRKSPAEETKAATPQEQVIHHGVPEQAKLDSLKKARTKAKKRQ